MKNFELTAKRNFHSDISLSLGLINNLEKAELFNNIRTSSNHILITDENVNKLYSVKVINKLEYLGFKVIKFVIPASDSAKNIDEYNKLVSKSLDYGFDKKSVIFSLGGGVVNNIAGFLASTLYRGIGLVHFPTSMLSQVDASIDFKQAINHDKGKNLIGSYYPASNIIIDPSLLKTLDNRFIYDGISESIKHALCQSREFYDYLLSNRNNLDKEEVLYTIVENSISLKLKLMNDNLEDDYDESIKQYGHALGHAIEHLSNGNIYHGEAISIGMCVSAEIAFIFGISTKEVLESHYKIFNLYNLPTIIPEIFSFKDIWNKMKYDKHTLDGKIYSGLIKEVEVMSQNKDGDFGYYIDEDLLLKAIIANKVRK